MKRGKIKEKERKKRRRSGRKEEKKEEGAEEKKEKMKKDQRDQEMGLRKFYRNVFTVTSPKKSNGSPYTTASCRETNPARI